MTSREEWIAARAAARERAAIERLPHSHYETRYGPGTIEMTISVRRGTRAVWTRDAAGNPGVRLVREELANV